MLLSKAGRIDREELDLEERSNASGKIAVTSLTINKSIYGVSTEIASDVCSKRSRVLAEQDKKQERYALRLTASAMMIIYTVCV